MKQVKGLGRTRFGTRLSPGRPRESGDPYAAANREGTEYESRLHGRHASKTLLATLTGTTRFIVVLTHVLAGVLTLAQKSAAQESFAPEQIRFGAELFSRNCSPCHGPHMQEPEGAFDLRTFPPDQHARFINSVSRGKNAMPPWSDLLKPDEIEALWAYVVAGEKRD